MNKVQDFVMEAMLRSKLPSGPFFKKIRVLFIAVACAAAAAIYFPKAPDDAVRIAGYVGMGSAFAAVLITSLTVNLAKIESGEIVVPQAKPNETEPYAPTGADTFDSPIDVAGIGQL